MANVLIVVYLLIVLALIAVILLQRSEGGALGMNSGGGGVSPARTTANLLTRTTAILAALFFVTAIGLTIVNELDRGSQSVLDSAIQGGSTNAAPTSVLDALNNLQGDDAAAPAPEAAPVDPDAPNLAVPVTEAPADAAPASGTGN